MNLFGIKVTPESITYDEVAHIASSYQYDHDMRAVLNPEHPILMKVLVGLPLQFIKLNQSDFTYDYLLSTNADHQWDYGQQLIFGHNPSISHHIISVARTAILTVNTILLVVVTILALKIFNKKVAIILLSLIVFNPSILGHATLVTFDVPSLLTTLITLLCFFGLIKYNNYKWAIYLGLASGVAAITKYSSIALILFIPIYYLIYALYKRKQDKLLSFRIKQLAIYSIVLVSVITIIYLPFTYGISAKDQYYQMFNTWYGHLNLFSKPLLTFLNNLSSPTKALGTWINGLFITNLEVGVFRPGIYFMNHVYNQPDWIMRLGYFPVIWLTKNPLPSIILLLVSIWILFKSKIKRATVSLRPETITIVYSAIYFIFAMYSMLKLGERHLLPFVGTISLITAIIIERNWDNIFFKIKVSSITYTLIVLSIISTLVSYPHFLSYFNYAVGGSKNAFTIAQDSNYDWGQDYIALRNWKDSNHDKHLYYDLFAADGVAEYYFGKDKNNYVKWYDNNLPEGSFIAVDTNVLTSSQASKGISYKDIFKKKIIRLTPSIFIFEK